MRFLADAGISPNTIDFLRRNGHDAVHVRELAMQRAPDRFLVEMAQAEGRSRGPRQRARRLHRARTMVIFGKDVRFNAVLVLALEK